jgi:hypothetical protein
MRSGACLFLALGLFTSTLCAQDHPKFSPAQQEVLNVRDALRETALRRDMAAWSRYVADDCIFSTDDGTLITKAQFIEYDQKLPPEYDHSTNPREYVIHVYGDTAVVNFRLTVHEQFTDADVISEQRQSETYIKRNGSWLLIARQWGLLPVNFHKPVAVDTSVYKDYVGHYQWRPLDDVETVSVKDGRLWSRFNKEKDADEYLPLSSDTFFVKDDIGSVMFVRDAQGHVTGYTCHRWDGQEIHVKRIN